MVEFVSNKMYINLRGRSFDIVLNVHDSNEDKDNDIKIQFSRRIITGI
jgi:hypothetical protein